MHFKLKNNYLNNLLILTLIVCITFTLSPLCAHANNISDNNASSPSSFSSSGYTTVKNNSELARVFKGSAKIQGDEVILTSSFKLDKYIKISADEQIKLNLNGLMISSSVLFTPIELYSGSLNISNGCIYSVGYQDYPCYGITVKGGNLNISNCQLQGPQGGIKTEGGTSAVNNCKLFGGVVAGGEKEGSGALSSGGTVNFNDCTLKGSHAGLKVLERGNANISNSKITGTNGINLSSAECNVTVNSGTINGDKNGYGFLLQNGTLTINNCEANGNDGIHMENGYLFVNGGKFKSTESFFAGYGLYTSGGSVLLCGGEYYGYNLFGKSFYSTSELLPLSMCFNSTVSTAYEDGKEIKNTFKNTISGKLTIIKK